MSTETGWTRETPRVNGCYWWKITPNGRPEPVYVDGGLVYDMGDPDAASIEKYENKGEWLGPVTPQDFEQLIRLRAAARQLVTAYEGKEHQLGNGQALRSFLSFREVLAHREGEKS